MPFPTEHAARIADADQFNDVRRKNNHLGDGIHAIFGITDDNGGGNKSEIISIRFDKKKFTPAQARKWLSSNDFKAKKFEAAADKEEKAGLVEFDLIIVKANIGEDGQPRWLATASDTDPDRTGEATSQALFRDFIDRIETGKAMPFLDPPRNPFLGVSHYPDLEGFGEAGITEKMYIDGQKFKAGGVFYSDDDHPLGPVLFQAVSAEQQYIKRGGQVEQPIRISAAWWDLQHAHGDFVFTRRSLTDSCPMCRRGAGDKVYLKGQLDHFATTRVPINPRTSLVLEEKSMATTRKADASTIVGDEYAEELEKRAKLVGKSESEADPDGLVIKSDEENEVEAAPAVESETDVVEKAKGKKKNPFAKADDEEEDAEMTKAKGKKRNPFVDDEDEDEEEVEKGMDEKKKRKGDLDLSHLDGDQLEAALVVLSEAGLIERMPDMEVAKMPSGPFGGAVTLDDAESFVQTKQKMDKVTDNWGMFLSVVNNIMHTQADMDEDEGDFVQRKLELMSQAVEDLGDRIAALKAGLADAYLLHPIAADDAVNEDQVEILEARSLAMTTENKQDHYDVLRSQVEAVLTNAELGRDQKAEAIQKALNDFVPVVRGELDTTNPPDVAKLVGEEVQKAFGPITEQLALITAKLNAQPQPEASQPAQKSLTVKGSATTGYTADQVGGPTSIRDIARRSVGLPV